MSLELGVMLCLGVIIFLMFHGGLGACVDSRVEDPKISTQIVGWTSIELEANTRVVFPYTCVMQRG